MTRPVRILLNALHAKTGGGTTYLKALLPRLAAREDVEIRLLIHRHQQALFQEIDLQKQIVDFKDGFARRLIWEQAILPAHSWDWADVTFSPANFGPLLARRPIVLLRNALDVSKHENRPAKKLYWAILKLMTWLSLLMAPRAMAVSSYAKEKLALGFGGKVEVVHHGIDLALFAPPSTARDDFILAVGDITVQKNFATLIEAVAQLPGTALRIAGKRVDEEHAVLLDRLVAKLGLQERVTFLGQVTPGDLASLYRRCKIFAFSSTVETFGHPLAEAMASGCAILCSRAAAMPEILGQAGLYAEPLNIDDWVKNLSCLQNDATLRGELSAKALVRARDFSWDVAAQKTAAILKEAAARPRSRKIEAIFACWVLVVGFLYLLQFTSVLQAALVHLKSL